MQTTIRPGRKLTRNTQDERAEGESCGQPPDPYRGSFPVPALLRRRRCTADLVLCQQPAAPPPPGQDPRRLPRPGLLVCCQWQSRWRSPLLRADHREPALRHPVIRRHRRQRHGPDAYQLGLHVYLVDALPELECRRQEGEEDVRLVYLGHLGFPLLSCTPAGPVDTHRPYLTYDAGVYYHLHAYRRSRLITHPRNIGTMFLAGVLLFIPHCSRE